MLAFFCEFCVSKVKCIYLWIALIMSHISYIIYLFPGTFFLCSQTHRQVTWLTVPFYSSYLGQQTYSGAAKVSCPLVRAGIQAGLCGLNAKFWGVQSSWLVACLTSQNRTAVSSKMIWHYQRGPPLPSKHFSQYSPLTIWPYSGVSELVRRIW